jgi:hypothetical protein
MASHFDAIGFGVGRERAAELLGAAVERATEAGAVVEHAAGRTLHYVDASGATLSLHFDRDGEFACGQPGFAGGTRFRWRPLDLVADPDGCRFCDLVHAELLDGDDELYYPFALTIETLGATRALIPFGEPGEVRFAGLWEEDEVWADETSFERDQDLGGAPFRVLRLETLGGVFDTCAAPASLEHDGLLAPGAVAGGTLWLVGRPPRCATGPWDPAASDGSSAGQG